MEQIIKYFPALTAMQKERFAALEGLYTEWNARINVISRREMASGEFLTRHVLHSLAIARVCDFGTGKPTDGKPGHDSPVQVLDIGTGGGFPAIPLAILFPGVHFTAVDSTGKKIRVVEEISRSIDLKNLTPVCSRVESLGKKFDYVVSRAVAPAATLLGWIERPRKGTILLKGGDLTAEMSEIASQWREYRIADWFDEPFFETKKVIYIN